MPSAQAPRARRPTGVRNLERELEFHAGCGRHLELGTLWGRLQIRVFPRNPRPQNPSASSDAFIAGARSLAEIMSKPMMERPSSKHCRQSPERMFEQNEATSGGSTSGIAWNGLYGFSTNFDDWAASLLAETRTRRLHPAQSMAQGLLFKERQAAGRSFLAHVGWLGGRA